MASESIMIWRHPSPFTVWHASDHWLASSQSLRELTLFTAVSIAVFKPMETSMSKKRISRALWIPVLRSFSSSSTRSWLTVVSDLQNTNGDWSLFCDTDALSIHRWCDQIPQWSHRGSNPAIAHRLRLVGSFEPTPAVTHIHLEWNLQAVDEHQPARNGPGSSVQPLKNHSTTLLDLSLGVQPPERVWQGWKETASPQYRPDDRMMLEQKAFAPPLELDSAYRIRKTGWRGGDKLYLQSWKFSDDEKLFNKVIWGVKITSSIND